MLQTREIASEPCFSQRSRSLAEQVAEAVRNRTTPLSQLLKRLLRTRIGAPLDA